MVHVENVFKAHSTQNVNQNVIRFFLVVIHANKNVLQNAFVKKSAKIFVIMVIVMTNAVISV